MTTLRMAGNLIWRTTVFALGYTLALMAGGALGGVLSPSGSAAPASLSLLLPVFISAFLMGIVLGPLASRIPASRGRHALVWTSLIFTNLGSVAIEGAFFAPDLIRLPMPALLIQQLLAASLGAVLLSILFARAGVSLPASRWFRQRHAPSWIWRFAVASLSYLVFYFVFGAINYQLVTSPYYATHAGGLAVPAPQVVLMAELVRAPLIILSLVPLLFTYAAARRRMMLLSGFLLFWVGGVVPLVLQAATLPAPLLLASGIEIFLQNSLTGAVAARLLWVDLSHAESGTGQDA